MKKIVLALVLLFPYAGFGQINADSLWRIIDEPGYSDSLKLEAYETITKHLLKTNPDSCRIVCREGLMFSEKLENYRFIWSFYNRIGRTYIEEDNIDKTIAYFVKALEVAEMAKDTFTIAQTMNNIGIMYEQAGNQDKALQYYLKSIEMKKQLRGTERDYFSIVMTQMYAGMLYLKQNRNEEADIIFNEVLGYIDFIENDDEKYIAYFNIGNYYAYFGSHRNIKRLVFDAIKYYHLAEGVIYKSGDMEKYGKTLVSLAEAYFFVDDFKTAQANMNKALEIAKQINSFYLYEFIYQVYENHYLNTNNYELAYYYKDSVQQMNDSINYFDRQKAIEEIQTKYQSEKKERENLALKKENQRQRRMRNFFIASTSVFLLLVVIITYLFSRLRLKNRQLTKSKEELEKLNLNLKKSKEETEKALEFKSLFLANMSHEIRTPLNIIIGFNSILKKQVDDHKMLKYLESIEMSSYNLLRFLNDILDMSKIEAGKIHLTPDNINLKMLIMNIRELFLVKAREKNLDFTVEIDPGMPHEIEIDEIRLRQILVNIIGNAIKFTEEGYVRVIADTPVLNEYRSEFSTKVNVRIRVEDSGIGISGEDTDKIFESFRQVNLQEQKQMGGTGLGLAISKRLTEMMNGEISVESKKGEGSTFTVLFRDIAIGKPTVTKQKKKAKIHETLEYEFTEGTILVADDEEMNRSLIRVCFENTKVTVLEAANGEEALELARKHKPDFIMMDIKMPGIDGLEATRIIKGEEKYRNIPVIAFSASNIFESLGKEDIAMFSGLISKPVLLDELYEKASKILPNKIKDKSMPKEEESLFNAETYRDDNIAETLEEAGIQIQTMKNSWSKILSTNSMTEILEFAGEIKDFADSKNLEGLKNYADKISEAGKNFDIDQVKKLLKLFPELFQNKKL